MAIEVGRQATSGIPTAVLMKGLGLENRVEIVDRRRTVSLMENANSSRDLNWTGHPEFTRQQFYRVFISSSDVR